MSSVIVKRMAVVGWDALSWVLAALAYFLVRFDLALSERVWQGVVLYTGLAIVLQVAAGFLFHLYLGRSRLGSFDEVTLLGTIVAGVSVVAGAVFLLTQPVFSRGAALVIPTLALLIMAAGRWVFRTAVAESGHGSGSGSVPALIYGAGDAGHQVARLLATADEPPTSSSASSTTTRASGTSGCGASACWAEAPTSSPWPDGPAPRSSSSRSPRPSPRSSRTSLTGARKPVSTSWSCPRSGR